MRCQIGAKYSCLTGNISLIQYVKASQAIFILQTPLAGTYLIPCILIQDHGLRRPKESNEQAQAQHQLEQSHEEEKRIDLAHQQLVDPGVIRSKKIGDIAVRRLESQ
jgi:hypothetical protein